jgi:hypothetical protein
MHFCRASRLALWLLAAGLAAAGCGGETSETTTEQQGVGAEIGGSTASLAQCRDWNGGSAEQRRATIADLRAALTPQSAPPDAEPVLSDEDAYDLFERACAAEFAAGFRLYKVYAQAQAFAPLRTDPTD